MKTAIQATNHPNVWRPPPPGIVKLNVDAGKIGDDGRGLGCAACNSEGHHSCRCSPRNRFHRPLIRGCLGCAIWLELR